MLTKCVARTVILHTRKKPLRVNPETKICLGDFYAFWGKNGFCPQKVCATTETTTMMTDGVQYFFFTFAIGCRLFIEITSVVCAPRPIPVATYEKKRKKHTCSHTRTQCKSGVQKFEYAQRKINGNVSGLGDVTRRGRQDKNQGKNTFPWDAVCAKPVTVCTEKNPL